MSIENDEQRPSTGEPSRPVLPRGGQKGVGDPDYRSAERPVGTDASAERDIALDTDEKTLARLTSKDRAVRKKALVVGSLVGAAILAWLALLLALGSTPIFLISGLFPALLAATITGVFLLGAKVNDDRQKRERARLAATIEAQAEAASQGSTLAFNALVNPHAAIPEVVDWSAAMPFEARDIVRSVMLLPGELSLGVGPDTELTDSWNSLMQKTEAAAVIAADQKRRYIPDDLTISPHDIVSEALSLSERQRSRRGLVIPIDGISRVHVAIEDGKWVVFHLFFRSGPSERVRVCSFTLANPSDFGGFWAALKSQIPPERLVLPRATVWQVRPGAG